MPYDDDDLDSVLLGGSDSPGDSVFGPFQSGYGEADTADDGPDGNNDYPDESDAADGVVRYGRFGGQDPGGFQPDDEGTLPWEGRTTQPTSGGEQQRELERTDAGIGNIRRVAESRSGGVGAGIARKSASPSVANNLQSAQQRIRADATNPLTDSERVESVKALDNGVRNRKITRHYERQAITRPPSFRTTNFEATLVGLKANTTGDWIVTLKVPQSHRGEATVLGDAYGLALDVVIVKHNFNPND